jgi:tetratricopeptide (TPR) repeat protein
LETELNEYSQTSDSIKVFDVLHPSDAGFISAKTSVERAQQAISLAERVNAHIVIYGVVEEQGSNIIISPEFLVATKYIQDAEEILGQHRLGTPIDIADSAENLSSLISFNKKLTDRSSALASITLGLFSYFIRDYTSARQFFQQADSLSSWDASEGKEVLYILTGNTEAKDGDLESADLYYQKAIALNHEYARGYIGRATVTFRQAILDSNHVDYDKVSEAISFFNDGLSAKDQPSFSHIDFKAQFGLGEASLLLTQAGIENELDAAESHFQFVVNYFLDNPDDLLRERAAQAYAHLGLIAYIKNKDMSNVGKYYESAASLSIEHNPDLAAQYWKKLAALYLEQNDVNSAMIYIKKAIQTAEDPDEKDRLQMMLEAYTHPK